MQRAKDEGRLRYIRKFQSKYLSTSRDLVIYLPPGYDPEAATRHPVLYLQDGQNLFDPATAFGGNDWQADRTADHLIMHGNVPPFLIVGIYNTGVRRISEYTPTRDKRSRKGGKGDRYAQMIAREIKPEIDKQFRTHKAPEMTAIGGSSLGGLVSLQAALLYPRVFGAAAVLSPSVWWDHRVILKMVRESRVKTRPRLWVDSGSQEGADPHQHLMDARALREALVETGWRPEVDLRYHEVYGEGHNEHAWGSRLGFVLNYLFGSRQGK